MQSMLHVAVEFPDRRYLGHSPVIPNNLNLPVVCSYCLLKAIYFSEFVQEPMPD